MDNQIKPIEYTEHLCFKCLKEKNHIHTYEIYDRGYGSIYDGTNTKLQLCDECNNELLEKWFNEQPTIKEYYEEYKYENNIEEFIDKLPVQGQELFENQCASGCTSYPMDSQDWIDIELGIAPDEVYKENNMYSPSEAKAYEDRFPTCKNVYLKVWSDGSKSCKCNFGAFGNEDGSCDVNISDECYYCQHYEKKDSNDNMKIKQELTLTKDDIKEITMKEWVCKNCGNINHTYNYQDEFVCEKCFERHEFINEEN